LQRGLAAALLCATAVSLAASAEDALNSNDKPVNADTNPEDRFKKKTDHSEGNFVPVVGGSTDIGIGGGYFANFARLSEGFDPYLWDIESAGLITFKSGDSGIVVPYADVYAKLTIPRLFGHPIRLEVRPSFTSEQTIHYYGLGNASPSTFPVGTKDTYQEYGRTHPQFDVDLRFKLADHYSGRLGARYIRNYIALNQDSKLVDDMNNGSAEVQSLLHNPGTHNVILLKTGLAWDTRDNEASTYSGAFDTVDLRVSPGGGGPFPYKYGEATLNLRAFVPLRTPWITLAGRLVGSALFGNVPFYELSRFDDTYALGGTGGVRGIPAGRFSGKAKVLGNIELRNELVAFHALGKPLVFGIVGFLDAGRVWTDWGSQSALDGTGLGLHWGTGVGLRLQSGSAFVLRADIAYSPDGPFGGYFSAGQLF